MSGSVDDARRSFAAVRSDLKHQHSAVVGNVSNVRINADFSSVPPASLTLKFVCSKKSTV